MAQVNLFLILKDGCNQMSKHLDTLLEYMRKWKLKKGNFNSSSGFRFTCFNDLKLLI